MLSCIVCCKLSDLCCDLQEKIFRWLTSHFLKYCIGTHETQIFPVESAADTLAFMQHIHPKISEQNHGPKFIINIDKTPIFFTCHSKKTLEWKGTKSVNIHTSTNDTKRVTLAVSVCVDGSKLPPMLIFKESQNCWIANNEFPNFPPSCKYYCQENA